uniref:Putative RNA ligase n=1 Tax=viral metagenome TaxID=1070528 RepID=A0A6M3JAL6_9ZZZZ
MYERNVDHCEVSRYVREVTIKTVKFAENSDNLDTILFEEIGWEAIASRNSLAVGEKVMFIPAESVLPFELSDALGVTRYLSTGRVRVVKLRGNRSEGIIAPIDIVIPYLDKIMKWETPPTVNMRGHHVRDVSPYFETFYRIPNILNEPYLFKKGEAIFISEKLHGASTKAGIIYHPLQEKYILYVGSHNTVLEDEDDVLFWQVYKKYLLDSTGASKLMVGIEFFGEVFGPGIQHFSYGRSVPDLKIFAALDMRRNYMPPDTLYSLCVNNDIPVVNFRKLLFSGDIEQFREYASEPSEYTDKHIREGIVIVSAEDPNKMAKCLNFEYTAMKNRTERK